MPTRTITDVFSARLQQVRKRYPLTQRQLSDRLRRLGRPLDHATIAKIEAGGSRAANLRVQDVITIAAALGVSPLHLLIPMDDDEAVSITSTIRITASEARAWIRDERPLPLLATPRTKDATELLVDGERWLGMWASEHPDSPGHAEAEALAWKAEAETLKAEAAAAAEENTKMNSRLIELLEQQSRMLKVLTTAAGAA